MQALAVGHGEGCQREEVSQAEWGFVRCLGAAGGAARVSGVGEEGVSGAARVSGSREVSKERENREDNVTVPQTTR